MKMYTLRRVAFPPSYIDERIFFEPVGLGEGSDALHQAGNRSRELFVGAVSVASAEVLKKSVFGVVPQRAHRSAGVHERFRAQHRRRRYRHEFGRVHVVEYRR